MSGYLAVADLLEDAIGGPMECPDDLRRLAADAFRQLEQTERERDEAVARVAALDTDVHNLGVTLTKAWGEARIAKEQLLEEKQKVPKAVCTCDRMSFAKSPYHAITCPMFQNDTQ